MSAMVDVFGCRVVILLLYIPGLVMRPLVDEYGCRMVALFSASITALGMSLVPFAPNITCLVVFYGFMGGILLFY